MTSKNDIPRDFLTHAIRICGAFQFGCHAILANQEVVSKIFFAKQN